MKKIVFAMMAAFLLTNTAMAQEVNGQKPKQFSKKEMIQHQTDGMVERYGLDKEQAAKLLELNTQFADKMPGRGFGPQRQGKRPDGKRFEGKRPVEKVGKAMRPDSIRHKGQGQRPDMEQMKKNMEEYEAQLKTILSTDQLKAFKADREKMRQRGPRNHNNDAPKKD